MFQDPVIDQVISLHATCSVVLTLNTMSRKRLVSFTNAHGHLNHLNLGICLYKKFRNFVCLCSCRLYRGNYFQVYLQPTLSAVDFLANPVYERLWKEIGEAAVY